MCASANGDKNKRMALLVHEERERERERERARDRENINKQTASQRWPNERPEIAEPTTSAHAMCHGSLSDFKRNVSLQPAQAEGKSRTFLSENETNARSLRAQNSAQL